MRLIEAAVHVHFFCKLRLGDFGEEVHYSFRECFVACLAPNHYLNQYK